MMKRLEEVTQVEQKMHDKMVDVQLSVLELMMIRAALGPLSTNMVRGKVEEMFGKKAAEEVGTMEQLDYELYDTAGRIIDEELSK